jgi:hypothetical protein
MRERVVALRSASSEFQAARLDKTARLAGESFAFDEGYKSPAAAGDHGHAMIWWSIAAVALPAIVYLGWG